MREQAVIQTLLVKRKKEYRYFQIHLPGDTKRIIGVETGLIAKDVFPAYDSYQTILTRQIRRNRLVGRLQLQAFEASNFFYSKEIFDRDINASLGEIVPLRTNLPIKTNPFREVTVNRLIQSGTHFFNYRGWSHGGRQEEDPLDVTGVKVINGWYRDYLGDYHNRDIQYTLMVYVWIERNLNQ